MSSSIRCIVVDRVTLVVALVLVWSSDDDSARVALIPRLVPLIVELPILVLEGVLA